MDAWLPHKLRGDRDTALTTVVARMHAGVSHQQVDAELASLSHAIEPSEDDRTRANRIVAVPLRDDVVARRATSSISLLIAVGLVLLVACVNVANLVLVRATGRVQEFAVRAALGSGRGRLAQQLLVENLVLSGFGGAVGLGLAALGINVLRALGRDALPRLDAVGFDPIVLAFAVVVTMATALACGVMPALRLARSDPNRRAPAAVAIGNRLATSGQTQKRPRRRAARACPRPPGRRRRPVGELL